MKPSRLIALAATAAVALALAGIGGLLAPDYLAELSSASCLLIGLFASLTTALLALGLRPAPLEAALVAAIMLVIGLASFGNRETELVASVTTRAGGGSSEYCPDPGGAAADAPPPPKAKPAVQARGCALIQRAFELGYAKDLGDCAPKELEVADQQTIERAICKLRQPDEPFLHWSWRLLARQADSLGDLSPGSAVADEIDQVTTRLDYAGTLLAQQAHAIEGTPRSSHHLFTNLPAPSSRSWLAELLAPEDCDDRYRDLIARVDWADLPAGALVEHAFAQLLFDGDFGPAAGACVEYHIHWDAPGDACQQLVADPTGFLDDADALDSVLGAIDRRRRRVELRALADELGEAQVLEEPPPTRGLVSFQCYMVDPAGTGEASERPIRIDQQVVEVRELRIPEIATAGAGQLAVYQQLATLLGGGRYSGPAEDVSAVQVAAPTPTPDQLAADFPLASLELVREADPFLDGAWPLERPELSEVYPMHFHLARFTEVFRRQYRARRGRL